MALCISDLYYAITLKLLKFFPEVVSIKFRCRVNINKNHSNYCQIRLNVGKCIYIKDQVGPKQASVNLNIAQKR